MARTFGKLAVVLAALAALAAAGLLISLETAVAIPVKLDVTKGEVEIGLGSPSTRQTVGEQGTLATGDRLRVLPGATARLTYGDGSTLTLAGGTEVKVAHSSRRQVHPLLCLLPLGGFCGSQDSLSYITTVVVGKARAHVPLLPNTARLFQVQTAHSLAAARSTIFEVEVNQEGRAQWRNIQGQVSVGYLLELDDGKLAATATLLGEGESLGVSPLPLPGPDRVQEVAGLMASIREAVRQAATESVAVDLAREGKALSFNAAGTQPANRPQALPATAQAPPAGSSCLECHQELKAKAQGKSRHQPFVKGECSACHRSFHERNRQRPSPEQEIALCLSCHPQSQLGLSHPVGPKLVDANTKGSLTCSSSCHDPHGSQYKALSRVGEGDKLCTSCHKVGTPGASSKGRIQAHRLPLGVWGH